MLVKAFAGLDWLRVEKGYNEWSRGVEVLSIATHVGQNGFLKLLVVYRVKPPTVSQSSIN